MGKVRNTTGQRASHCGSCCRAGQGSVHSTSQLLPPIPLQVSQVHSGHTQVMSLLLAAEPGMGWRNIMEILNQVKASTVYRQRVAEAESRIPWMLHCGVWRGSEGAWRTVKNVRMEKSHHGAMSGKSGQNL